MRGGASAPPFLISETFSNPVDKHSERRYLTHMARLTNPTTFDFDGFATLLGDKAGRKIGNNTYVERIDADTIGIRLHYTVIVSYTSDGRIILNSGGYRTTTTKGRMNEVLPQNTRISQKSYEWFITTPGKFGGKMVVPFEDGAEIDTNACSVTVPVSF